MEIQKSTINLINSMTMNEKRHFKIFFQKHNFGTQNKNTILFDIINKYSTINEELIKKHFKNYDYSSKNISYDINYLNKLILKALNDFHSEKTINIRIKDNLKSIEILFYKGLYDECLKLIKKTKKISLKNENEYLTLDILNWEKKCVGYSSGFFAAQSINEQIDDYFELIIENRKITDLYYESYSLKNSVGKNAIQKIIEQFDVLLSHKLIANLNLNNASIQSNIFYNLIYANYFHVKKDKEKELHYLEKTIMIFNANDYYKKENPLDYISVFNRLIDIYKKTNDTLFYKKIIELRNFENILDFQKDVSLERIFLHTYQAELEYLMYNDNKEKALKIMEELIPKINSNKFNIEPYYFIGLFYQFSCIYLTNKNLSKSLKYINIILNEYKLKDRPNSFIKAEILNIIIHYSLKNYKLVIYNLDNYHKKYKRSFKLNYIEKLLLKSISKISENPFSTNEKNEFKSLLLKINSKNNIEKSTSNKVYLNFISNKINTN
jgi:hypothetical protein